MLLTHIYASGCHANKRNYELVLTITTSAMDRMTAKHDPTDGNFGHFQ